MATNWWENGNTEHTEVIEGAEGNASGTIVSEGNVSGDGTTVKKDDEAGSVTPAKSNRRVQKETRANELVNFLAQKEAELGRDLTQQEMSDWADGKGLWAYQSLNNKKGNWANAFGSRDFFGKLNNDTYTLLRKDLDAKKTQRKQADITNNRSDRVLQTITLNDGTTRDVTRGAQIMHQNFWGQGINQNDMTPEQATAFVNLLKTNGADIPETVKFEENTTLFNILQQLQPYVDDDELDVLGYYDDNDNLTVPHKETFEEMKARREKLEEDMKLKAQQKALDRQRARYGLADLAAGIGDIIKASGGAIVNPRDYQNMYNTLTAQQQTNYNNYLARMQALKEAERAKQQLADERAYQENLYRTQHERDMEKLIQAQKFQREERIGKQEYEAGESEKERNLKLAITELTTGTEYAGKVTAAQIKAATDEIKVPIGNTVYTFGSKAAADIAAGQAFGLIKDVIVGEDGKYKEPYGAMLTGLMDKGVESENALIAIMRMALQSEDVLSNPELLAKVKNSLKLSALKVGEVTTDGGAGGTTGGASTVKKKYQRTNADGSVTTKEMTDEEYNALDQSIRDKYTLVTE